MRYSLRTLVVMMLLGGPALALVWWLRGVWAVQVLAILLLMTAAVCTVCWLLSGLFTICERLVRVWIETRE
jgi:hypothetical protein